MKRKALLFGSLLLLACLSGFLMSKASWAGRTGMSLFYREYVFLKTWWQGAAAVAGVWLLLFILQGVIAGRYDRKKSMTVHISAIILAFIGLFFTYQDFSNTLSHRMLGTSFHVGAYLFWLGWIGISVFYLMNLREPPASTRTNAPARNK